MDKEVSYSIYSTVQPGNEARIVMEGIMQGSSSIEHHHRYGIGKEMREGS